MRGVRTYFPEYSYYEVFTVEDLVTQLMNTRNTLYHRMKSHSCIVFSIGQNDINKKRVPTIEVIQNLKYILKETLKVCSKIVVISPPPMRHSNINADIYCSELRDLYNDLQTDQIKIVNPKSSMDEVWHIIPSSSNDTMMFKW